MEGREQGQAVDLGSQKEGVGRVRNPGRGSSEVRPHRASGLVAQAALTSGSRAPQPRPSLQGGRPLSGEEKQPCLGAHTWGIGFQEHSITCSGQSPGEGAVHPSLPVSSPHCWLPTKKLLTFLKASEYTVHLCGVGAPGEQSQLNEVTARSPGWWEGEVGCVCGGGGGVHPGRKKRKCLVSRGELKGRVYKVETGSLHPLSWKISR